LPQQLDLILWGWTAWLVGVASDCSSIENSQQVRADRNLSHAQAGSKFRDETAVVINEGR